MELIFNNRVFPAARMPRAALYRYAKRCLQQYADASARARSLGVVFVSAAAMKRMNAKYRGKDCATNVLSFVMRDEHSLGDVILCPAIAYKESARLGIAKQKWIAYLFVHGMLHLLGFTHENRARARHMERASKSILGYEL